MVIYSPYIDFREVIFMLLAYPEFLNDPLVIELLKYEDYLKKLKRKQIYFCFEIGCGRYYNEEGKSNEELLEKCERKIVECKEKIKELKEKIIREKR